MDVTATDQQRPLSVTAGSVYSCQEGPAFRVAALLPAPGLQSPFVRVPGYTSARMEEARFDCDVRGG